MVRRFCTGVALAVVAGLIAATLAFELRLLRTSTLAPRYPMTIYQPMATPGTSLEPGAPGAAGVDFSQVYTSALALRNDQSAYQPRSQRFRDYWGRPPGYPPLMNWVALPLSFLPYADALTLHTCLSLLGLFAATAFVLWRGGVARHIAPVFAVQSCLYFLTPIGVTHLERGQFDVVVASASTLAVGCALLPSSWFALAVISGFLGALKWTSVSFLACFAGFGFLLAAGRRRWAFALIPVVMALGTLPFWNQLVEYWNTIRVYEIEAQPYGLTLQHLMPRNVARAAPVVTTLALAAFVFYRLRSPEQRAAALLNVSAPFSMMLMNFAVCFGTLSYEYHTVTTLGMIPGLVLWVDQARSVSTTLKASLCAAFGVFVVIAFRTYGFGSDLSPVAMTAVYAAFALVFFAIAVAVVAKLPRLATGAASF